MTEIRCEHCGPTRIAPHDVNCPNRDPEVTAMYAHGIPERTTVKKGDLLGYVGGPEPITVETAPEMFSPIAEKAKVHYTVRGRRGAECFCGFNPSIDHPDAGRGLLFAYVGQHIKNESGI